MVWQAILMALAIGIPLISFWAGLFCLMVWIHNTIMSSQK